MARTIRDIPPPLEMLCLKALWALGEGNVSEIREIVVRSRMLAYTTIMTVLERLVRKGKLSRRKVGRAYVYSLQVSIEKMRRAAVRELVDGFFDGSEEELMRFLAGSDRAISAKQPVAEEAPIDTVLL